MTTSATPRNYEGPFRSFDRETVAKSLVASMLLAALLAFAFTVGQIVQESRAAGHVTDASATVTKAERSGVLIAQMPLF